jgi:hypothetical protein
MEDCLHQHHRQPQGHRRGRRIRAAEGLAGVQVHQGPLDQSLRVVEIPRDWRHETNRLMRQMKVLSPTDDRPGTTFMAMFLLRLPSDMRDHLIAKDFKDCTLMAEYADPLYSSRAGSTVTAVNTGYEAAINAASGGRRWEFSPHDRRQTHCSRAARGAAP